MKTKRGLRVVSFLMIVCMLSFGTGVIDSKAATGNIITITTAGQVVDTFNGVSSLYRPGSWDGTDATYGCHAYVMRYYQAIYGKSVYNLFHECTPCTYGDTFVEVTNPQPGDICAQVKSSTNHWSIVKSVANGVVNVIDQNNKWQINGVTYAYQNYSYALSEVKFYRLASIVNGAAVTTAQTTTQQVTTQQSTEAGQMTTDVVIKATETMSVKKGAKKKITTRYVAQLANGPAVKWKSSKKSVAKVSTKGYVTGVKKGSATMTGTMSDGQQVALKVKVTVPAQKLKLVSDDVTLPQNTSWQLTAKLTPAKSNDILTFSSSNKNIATVNSKGVVTSYSTRGMTYITVKTGSGLKKKCIVRVY